MENRDRPQKVERIEVRALDEILGEPFPVLDDGFVRVVDYMGSDASIVQAARVSYGAGTKKVSRDRALIRYLMQHWHTTPFEMCEIKLHVRAPMDCWRQWIRHRTANVNEYSTRYSVAIDSTVHTEPGAWRAQSAVNKQGSEEALNPALGAELTREEAELHAACRDAYLRRIDRGVAREQARKDLPLSTYTEAYWKIDLHNLLHFLRLRMADNAQYEIRCYAKTIGHEIVKRWAPLAWEAFEDYRVGAMQLSRDEADVVSRLAAGDRDGARALVEEWGWIGPDGKKAIEAVEFGEKLARLGFAAPWDA